MFNLLKGAVKHPYLLFISFISFLLSTVFFSLHYKGIYYGSPLTWIGWVIGMLSFTISFSSLKISNLKLIRIKKLDLLLFGFIFVLFFASHLMNFSTAPWNSNGLFDDAAWDIYFAKNHVFNNVPFQPAYFDPVGIISREVIFHYYISTFFILFGYNLLVFNISLLSLGFITVLFTTFLIQRMFNNIFVTIISAVVINFFPLHFMHIFMGHRYAITAPLMIISLYFLYTAFLNNSFFRASISSFFASFTLGSAIMGKQYLYGLVLSTVLIILLSRRESKFSQKISLGLVWLSGFVIAATPLLVYIFFNYAEYTLREKSLTNQFISRFNEEGIYGIKFYFDQLKELFFAKHSYLRQFLPGFYPIPLSYYFLLIPGLFIALIKKRFEIVFLSLIPVFAAFVSGSYDFRILIGVPIWIIAMSFTLNYIFVRFSFRYVFLTIGLIALGFGLLPSIKYIWVVSKNPNYLYLLPHKDVAVSRFVQDIATGEDNPTSKMKKDELNRKVNMSFVPYDTFVCPYGAYAIMHLYLQNYDDKKILSFCDQGIQLLKTPTEIWINNMVAIQNYQTSDRNLKLIWEVSDKSINIIKAFSVYKKYGSEKIFFQTVDNNSFSIYVLTINNRYIEQFKQDIIKQSYL